uniref:Uncharacterized protein n=1 Tax=Pelusios castaneus TaxID=367368 RepID=A0A8C8RKQ7_9SAUR
MAGKGGRGRGRGQMTFNVEAVGIGKGDSLPPSTLQPSPLFPPMEYKPVPLQTGEEVEYMLALKQELRGAMKNLPYYVKPAAPKKDVERYSDKYQTSGPIENAIDWKPDWRRLPRELKIRVRKLQKESTTILIPKHKQRLPVDKEETIKKLEVTGFPVICWVWNPFASPAQLGIRRVLHLSWIADLLLSFPPVSCPSSLSHTHSSSHLLGQLRKACHFRK